MPPLIYIHWRDANYVIEDTVHSELGELLDLHEFGFLIKETPEAYVICSEHSPGSISSRLTVTIPKINIVEAKIYKADSILTRGRRVTR